MCSLPDLEGIAVAQKKKARQSGRPEEEDFVSDLAPDPASIPDTRMLIGFVGESTKDGYLRLYLTPELNEFYEIQEADVVRSQKLPAGELNLAGTAIWIKRDSKIQHTRTTTVDAQADFLQGTIARSFLTSAARAGTFGAGFGQFGIKSVPPVASVCFSCATDNCPVPTSGGSTCEYGCSHVCTLSTRCRTEFLCF